MGANLFNWGGQAEIEVIFSIEGTPSADCRVEVLTSPRLIYRGQGLTPSRANDSPWQIKIHMCRLWRWIKMQNLQGKAREASNRILEILLWRNMERLLRFKRRGPMIFSVCVDDDANIQNKKTLPKAQRTRGLSSSYQSNFLRLYHKFKHKS